MPAADSEFDAARARRPITLREALASLRPGRRALETRATWSRRLASPDNVPAEFRAEIGDDPFPYSVFTPALPVGLLHRTHPQVWSSGHGNISAHADTGNGITTRQFPGDGIIHVRVTKTLLRTRISLAGTGTDGAGRAASIEINTVTDSLFDPILDYARGSSGERVARPRPLTEAAGLLGQKFAILAGRALLPDDRVEQAVANPALRSNGTGPPWARNRVLAPARLLLLTERELILITDDGSRGAAADGGYGGIRDHIPRCRVSGASLQEAGPAVELVLDLPAGHVLNARFAASTGGDLESLIARL
jgi:hypothetical protein